MKTIESEMNAKIKASGFRRNFICEKTGIKEVDLSLSLNGKRRLTTKEFISLCVFLGLNLSDFECTRQI